MCSSGDITYAMLEIYICYVGDLIYEMVKTYHVQYLRHNI